METSDTVFFRSLDEIRRTIAEETRLESERRGALVPPHDPSVQENVRRSILRRGRASCGNIADCAEPAAMEFQLIAVEEPVDETEHHAAA